MDAGYLMPWVMLPDVVDNTEERTGARASIVISHTFTCACVRACMRSCVRVCVHTYVFVCVCACPIYIHTACTKYR
jgi:hypothetical protein